MKSPGQLKRLPQHVAIIMDGNGRWARQHGLPRLVGHKQGATTAQHVVEVFVEYKIPYLTLYAFSTENWNRPQREVRGLFRLLEERLDEGISLAQKEGIRIHHLGKLNGLSPKIQDAIRRALELTQDNTRMTLGLAFNYGGRDEIVEATRRLILKGIPAQDIDETVVGQYLYTAGIPDPDLIIRTGGEMRLSNFLTWQSAYAEIYFTPVLWPDFDKKEIDKALTIFSQRQRRFGSLAPE
ncbi:MAG: di-trans,poly-cis-decaprenylcistransferase [Dehalococcoidia bacterium]|nr:di-trans,poly-cis-decaprenylcistransferase [Dehalococcoidia bacterium]